MGSSFQNAEKALCNFPPNASLWFGVSRSYIIELINRSDRTDSRHLRWSKYQGEVSLGDRRDLGASEGRGGGWPSSGALLAYPQFLRSAVLDQEGFVALEADALS